MITKEITVKRKGGLDVDGAREFVTTMTRFVADGKISIDNNVYNAKSIMNIMAACIKEGQKIVVCFEGMDEQEAIKRVEELLC